VEPQESGPGTVWEQLVVLALPAGTQVMRVDSRPGPAARKDPLAYLRSGAKLPPRKTQRTYFRVDDSGRLVQIQER
jgi:hypothetical protein